jgi:hypothetical protein
MALELADDILSSFSLADRTQLWGLYISVHGTSQLLQGQRTIHNLSLFFSVILITPRKLRYKQNLVSDVAK